MKQTRKDNQMKCPVCGSTKFFLKDPVDDYETYEFAIENGQPVFPAEPQDLQPDTESFCQRCSWHGPWGELCRR